MRVLATGESSGLTEPGLQVVRNPADFERLWAVIESYHSARTPPPDVDWSQEMAIVVALGTRPSGGYRVRVDRLTERLGTMTVHAREIQPGGEIVTDLLTEPFIAIATPAYPGAIELETTVIQYG
jgi:hypothetical protein